VYLHGIHAPVHVLLYGKALGIKPCKELGFHRVTVGEGGEIRFCLNLEQIVTCIGRDQVQVKVELVVGYVTDGYHHDLHLTKRLESLLKIRWWR